MNLPFAEPEMLWLLLVTAPLLAWFLTWSWRRRQQLISLFVQSRLLAQLTVGVSKGRQKLRLVLVGVAACLILLALARPIFGFVWEEVHQRGLDIVVAIDTSRSMLAGDVSPNRITRAKLAALDLMKLARTDRLGLVAFAGNAFLQCPLTLDDSTFQQSVNLLDVGLLPQGGTALAEAIRTGLEAFKDSGDAHKVMVIFSDGEDHEQGVVQAAEDASRAGVKIFTVGVGTATGDRLRVVDEKGRTTYIVDNQGKQVVSKLNDPLLREIAKISGGDYLALAGADPMQALYRARLEPLPRSEVATRLARQKQERFQWPLGLAIALLLIELFVPDRRRVQRAEASPGAGSPDMRRLFTCLAALLWLSGVATAVAGEATPDKGELAKRRAAFAEWQRLSAQAPTNAALNYNAGTAALAAGQLAAATNHLESATLAGDPRLLRDAYYNLGGARFRVGEQNTNLMARLHEWESALAAYTNALELDPADLDARYNTNVVVAKLEELKKLLPKPPPQKGGQDKSQNQSSPQDKQDQQKRPQDKSDAEKQPSQKQDQPGQPGEDQKDKSGKPEKQDKGSQGQQGKDSEKPQSQDSPEPKPNPAQREQDRPKQSGQGQAQPGQEDHRDGTNATAAAAMDAKPGQMSRDQARQLLEIGRGEERPWQPVPPRDPKRLNREIRDW